MRLSPTLNPYSSLCSTATLVVIFISLHLPFISGRCVMEIFTFLRIGAQKRIIVLPLVPDANPTDEQVAVATDEVRQLFGAFDASTAQCYASDRDPLLGAIETGFESVDQFSVICRTELLKALDKEAGSSEESRVLASRGDPDSKPSARLKLFSGSSSKSLRAQPADATVSLHAVDFLGCCDALIFGAHICVQGGVTPFSFSHLCGRLPPCWLAPPCPICDRGTQS